jgi:hypothetical protein
MCGCANFKCADDHKIPIVTQLINLHIPTFAYMPIKSSAHLLIFTVLTKFNKKIVASSQPFSKEERFKMKNIIISFPKVLSFGEDLGEANKQHLIQEQNI